MNETENKEVTPSLLRYICPDNWSDQKKVANPIDAEEIVEAIKDGKVVEIINAVIEGPFILKYTNVEENITIQRTRIRGQVDWSYSAFKQMLKLENSTFETDATFTGIIVEKDIFQDNVTFLGKATFSDIMVNGVIHSRDSTFKKEAIFVESIFKKRVEFRETTFEGKVIFYQTQIEGRAFFDTATFKDEANFGSARIGGTAVFNRAKFKKIVIFNGANIEGGALFNSAIFEDDVDFYGAQINNIAEFYEAVFNKKANFGLIRIKTMIGFSSTIFKGKVNFNQAQIDGNAFFDTTVFEDETNFGSTRIGGFAVFNGAKFKRYLFQWDKIPGSDNVRLIDFIKKNFGIDWGKTDKIEKINDDKTIIVSVEKNTLSLSLNDKETKVNLKIDDGRTEELSAMLENGKLNIYLKRLVNFNNAKIDWGVFFNKTIFEDEVDFGSIRIGNTAEFTESKFKKLVNFSRANIEGNASFDQSTFEGKVIFIAARIVGNANFDHAHFKQDVTFSIANIVGSAKFHSVIFNEDVNFSGAIISSTAEFNDANFNQKAIFNSAKIDGAAFFISAIFEGDFDFIGVQIGLAVDFQEAEFKQIADFGHAHIKKFVKFKSTIFNGKVKIEHAQIEEAISLNGAYFTNDVSFKYTSLGTFYFEKSSEEIVDQIEKLHIQPNVKIDLRGCIYDTIDPIDFWEELMKHLNPYDRQPFTQLEETFRRAGKENLADDMYYVQKRRESDQKKLRNLGAWLLDRLYWKLTGYGVRLYYLIAPIVLILFVGTIIFQFEGAVEPRLDMQPPLHLPFWEAFWVSLNTFLPVEIPSGANWIPSSKIIGVLGIKFTTFATLLKLAGWVLVPVGIAGISGILKR